MNNIAGALYRVIEIKNETKWSAAGEWGQCHASVSSNSHVFKRLRKVSSDGCSKWKKTCLSVGAAWIAGQDRSMWRTLRPSAGQAQEDEEEVSVIKQYNLVVAKCWWCWEGNCGLMSHWSMVMYHSLRGSLTDRLKAVEREINILPKFI